MNKFVDNLGKNGLLVDDTPYKNDTRKILECLHEDMESTLLNCMAAGVPISNFIITEPEFKIENNECCVEFHIGFLSMPH